MPAPSATAAGTARERRRREPAQGAAGRSRRQAATAPALSPCRYAQSRSLPGAALAASACPLLQAGRAAARPCPAGGGRGPSGAAGSGAGAAGSGAGPAGAASPRRRGPLRRAGGALAGACPFKIWPRPSPREPRQPQVRRRAGDPRGAAPSPPPPPLRPRACGAGGAGARVPPPGGWREGVGGSFVEAAALLSRPARPLRGRPRGRQGLGQGGGAAVARP